MNDTVETSAKSRKRTLSEHASKQFLARYGIPVTKEELVRTGAEAVSAARRIGFPVVLKACGGTLAHKTEAGAVFLNITDEAGIGQAFERIATGIKGRLDGVLVQEMLDGIWLPCGSGRGL